MSSEQRLDRLEAVVQVIAEDQVSLQKLIGQLATETRNGFDQVARQFAETDRRIHEMNQRTDARFKETDERMRQTDERIDKLAQEGRERARYFDERVDKLVLAIGEFIRRGDPPA
jgi:hypothetical protein